MTKRPTDEWLNEHITFTPGHETRTFSTATVYLDGDAIACERTSWGMPISRLIHERPGSPVHMWAALKASRQTKIPIEYDPYGGHFATRDLAVRAVGEATPSDGWLGTLRVLEEYYGDGYFVQFNEMADLVHFLIQTQKLHDPPEGLSIGLILSKPDPETGTERADIMWRSDEKNCDERNLCLLPADRRARFPGVPWMLANTFKTAGDRQSVEWAIQKALCGGKTAAEVVEMMKDTVTIEGT